MCTVEAEQFIIGVVDSKVGDDAMFTAYDISKAVQKKLNESGSQNERHRDLKTRIHIEAQTYVDNDLYEKQLADVGAPTQAFLYFPKGGDPSQYVPQERRGNVPTAKVTTAPTSTLSPTLAATATDDDDDDEGDCKDSGGRATDKRGSLSVPNWFIKAVGFNHKETAYITAKTENGESTLIVSKKAPAGLSPLSTTYTVDANTNIRITSAVLKEGGLDSDKTFDFELKNDQVIVREHK